MSAAATLLHCCDPLDERRVDAHFAAEAQAARACGATVVRLDHDALLGGDTERAVARVPVGAGPLWYRGWMVPAERYAALDEALRARGGSLAVTPDEYRRAHELPGWYAAFAHLTPAGAWLPAAPGQPPTADGLTALARRLPAGPGIVKDYVKSRKHEWDEACFIPDLADATALRRVVGRFVELQGDALAGGVVLRAFERFVTPPDGAAAEVRIWWSGGEPRLLTAHPDSPTGRLPAAEALASGLGPVRDAVRELGCRFVTTDLALREDGVWRVVEVGDGQVSDLHKDVDLPVFAGLLTDLRHLVQLAR
ncbi:ATP-grasp domain-containing protein [Streptomyces bambusae]|uniref:ATP-grasp domain-containing protein n=1 Tax=Streptomyces bambusae TaxID=1550616 RepID=A0ABS6Z9K3_9ACTN|nr:ATP-grasp domain-containing protein [Streptomyces bambusae]MBW5483888.1 hypothetical protein [Streptomyces bambusae]